MNTEKGDGRLRRVVTRGALLGLFAALVLSAVPASLGILILSLPDLGQALTSGVYALPLLVGVLLAISIGVPAIIAGSLNALALYVLALRGKITVVEGMIVGALLGLASSGLAVAIAVLLTNQVVADTYGASSLRDVWHPVLGGVAVPIGCWHGWRMVRYLQYNVLPR